MASSWRADACIAFLQGEDERVPILMPRASSTGCDEDRPRRQRDCYCTSGKGIRATGYRETPFVTCHARRDIDRPSDCVFRPRRFFVGTSREERGDNRGGQHR